MKAAEINNNPIAREWKERYSKLSEEKKKKIDELDNMMIPEYQLKVIKRSRTYPEIGDIFKINPKDDIFYYGIVINNHITSIYGEDLLVVLIFDNNEKIEDKLSKKILRKDLLLTPCLVGKEYWTRGYFFNIGHEDKQISIESYGFYGLFDGLYYNEYNDKLNYIPELVSMGVYTISGIAYEMNKEMIIRES
ncbi:MAG: hypothetical protein II220_10790 [Spirochaetales bacterium]|nr:hypothetical protein [Spirochaetales bacterium]